MAHKLPDETTTSMALYHVKDVGDKEEHTRICVVSSVNIETDFTRPSARISLSLFDETMMITDIAASHELFGNFLEGGDFVLRWNDFGIKLE